MIARPGHSVADVMSSLHPSALMWPDEFGVARPLSMPSVGVDAPVSEAAAEFLRTGAIVLAVVEPETRRPIGLVCRQAVARR